MGPASLVWGQLVWNQFGRRSDGEDPPTQAEEASAPSENSFPALVSAGSLTEIAFYRIEELLDLERRWSWDPRSWRQRWAEPGTLQHIEELLAAAFGIVDREDVEVRHDQRIGEDWEPDHHEPGWRSFEGNKRSLCPARDAALQCGLEAATGDSRPAVAGGPSLQLRRYRSRRGPP